MTSLSPEAFACRPVERAPLPRTVWHIAVAALIGNAYGPEYDVASQRVMPGSRWSGPMGRPVPISECQMKESVVSAPVSILLRQRLEYGPDKGSKEERLAARVDDYESALSAANENRAWLQSEVERLTKESATRLEITNDTLKRERTHLADITRITKERDELRELARAASEKDNDYISKLRDELSRMQEAERELTKLINGE